MCTAVNPLECLLVSRVRTRERERERTHRDVDLVSVPPVVAFLTTGGRNDDDICPSRVKSLGRAPRIDDLTSPTVGNELDVARAEARGASWNTSLKAAFEPTHRALKEWTRAERRQIATRFHFISFIHSCGASAARGA